MRKRSKRHHKHAKITIETIPEITMAAPAAPKGYEVENLKIWVDEQGEICKSYTLRETGSVMTV